MQPYFFPYWGHFSLIAHTKQWIMFDECQYKPKSWLNRNRILHPTKDWQYITVALSNSSRNIRIKDACVFDPIDSRDHILGKLAFYRKKAPFYSEAVSLVEQAFSLIDENYSLTSLCKGSLTVVAKYLNIKHQPVLSSSLELTYPSNISAGQWAPFICNSINASGYLNPSSGFNLFDVNDFAKLNIEFWTLSPQEFVYEQSTRTFSSNLSILDSIMWVDPISIKDALINNVNLRRHA